MSMIRFAAVLLFGLAAQAAEPLRLHPQNPHYFLFRGRLAVLVTSGEHYGAVINADFDFRTYLDTLRRAGLNNTRVWAGAYREVPGNFAIERNTLAPEPARFVAPWKQTAGRFDLNQWDPVYFERLHAFMRAASKAGVVVEMNLFCPFYEDSMWEVSPMNGRNNVQGIGNVPRTEALTMKHGDLVQVQEAMVRKLVQELRGYDNLYYEIANEPYFGGVTLDWQQHIARVITDEEKKLGVRHLISQNIANGSQRIEKPFAEVSIFNFHYSRPPDSVGLNYDLNRVIGNNETGFDGTADATYRIQGWDFLMAGGALYNNLDYSFVVGHERGDFRYSEKSPGGGSNTLRSQLGILVRFFDSMPVIQMKPVADVLEAQPATASARVLAEPGRLYAIYLHRGKAVKDGKPPFQVSAENRPESLRLRVPAGRYAVEWWDTKSGIRRNENRQSASEILHIDTPAFTEDLAIRVVRR